MKPDPGKQHPEKNHSKKYPTRKQPGKKVMCFGTFDLLHLGHVHYLREAKHNGDFLVVVIARDATKKIQQKETIFSEGERLQLIQSLGIVDQAVLGYPENHFRIIQEHQPDIICLGYDHSIEEQVLREKLAALGLSPKIERISAYKPNKHKTTLLKQQILQLE
jgi:FAD synthetase